MGSTVSKKAESNSKKDSKKDSKKTKDDNAASYVLMKRTLRKITVYNEGYVDMEFVGNQVIRVEI